MKLKKIIWTLPVIIMAPIVIIASCETNNSKEKEEETTKEMNQLTSNLFEKNKSNQLASISSTYELSVRTSEIEDAISKLNENKTLLSESDFNFDRSNLVSALSAIERRKQEIQAEEARVEAQRVAQERAAQEAAQRVAQEKAQAQEAAQEERTKTQKTNQQTTIEQSNPNTTQTSNQNKSININIDKSSKQIIQQSVKNAAKAALGKTAQVAKSAADAAITTAKQNTPINPSNVSVKDTINQIISNAKEATKETAKAAVKAAGQELLRSGIKGVINLWKEKREQKKQEKTAKSQPN